MSAPTSPMASQSSRPISHRVGWVLGALCIVVLATGCRPEANANAETTTSNTRDVVTPAPVSAPAAAAADPAPVAAPAREPAAVSAVAAARSATQGSVSNAKSKFAKKSAHKPVEAPSPAHPEAAPPAQTPAPPAAAPPRPASRQVDMDPYGGGAAPTTKPKMGDEQPYG
jgi:hypothetical protein